MRKLIAIGTTVFLMSACSSAPETTANSDAPFSVADYGGVVEGPVQRRLSWMEGDYQNDYEPDRKVAEAEAARYTAKVPDPSDVDEYLEYLSVLDASGKKAEAEKKMKAFLANNPKEKRAAFILGVHYMRIGKKELAGHFFSQLEKDNSFPWKSLLYNNLGMMALQDKNRDAAIAHFEKAIKSGPPTAAPYVNLGALYLQSKSYGDALALFKKAYDIDEDFEDAALGYGVSLEGIGKHEEAQKIYAEYNENHPNSLSTLYNNAVVLGNRLKRRDEAAQLMLRYIQRGGKETAKAHEIIQSWR